MDNGNLTAINKARQYFEKQTGKPAPTNYSTLAIGSWRGFPAIMTGGGTGPERDELAAPMQKLRTALTAAQRAVKQAITALAGKTDGLRTSWDASTNGTQGALKAFPLGPATLKALGLPAGNSSVGSTGVTLNPGQSHSVGGLHGDAGQLMATYQVKGPNGESYSIQGPDDADPSDVIRQVSGAKPAPKQYDYVNGQTVPASYLPRRLLKARSAIAACRTSSPARARPRTTWDGVRARWSD